MQKEAIPNGEAAPDSSGQLLAPRSERASGQPESPQTNGSPDEAELRAEAKIGRKDGAQSQKAGIVAEFTRLANVLDEAGLGPADYLYAALKWRLQRPDAKRYNLKQALRKNCRSVLVDPPLMPKGLRHTKIIAASSYLISANFLREVVSGLHPDEAVFCDLRDGPLSVLLKAWCRLRALVALGPALIFTARVRAALLKAKAGEVEVNRISLAAFLHRIHRQTARAILTCTRPKALAIGNGNRPPEFALWAEARKRSISTILLPYSEVALKPERFLSLCRGAFDLALPFSESSAVQLRKLNPDLHTKVVGFPVGFNAAGGGEGNADEREAGGLEILYFGGNNFEEAAAGLLRDAIGGFKDVQLRVRLHPRNQDTEAREAFAWLDPAYISDPRDTALASDISRAIIATAVRSTAALDAMIAGVPFVWLSPLEAQEPLKYSTLRKQNLALFEASDPAELRSAIQSLLADKDERSRVVKEQWSRLRAAGYLGDYFAEVRTAFREMIAERPQPR